MDDLGLYMMWSSFHKQEEEIVQYICKINKQNLKLV